jgi:hypothetical protein
MRIASLLPGKAPQFPLPATAGAEHALRAIRRLAQPAGALSVILWQASAARMEGDLHGENR